ncbi:B3 domain-containing protein [Actinidia chinensis var. chinensis]|uniref:B3 domain-containing protein n=1 Tax=Actinidia chinensis var. chinensis TaxID=1590841 RepID=A0A2R6PEX3_ACTCC|nr:B3 domain-containing protein [Actinidia chinensis var. chinensis]
MKTNFTVAAGTNMTVEERIASFRYYSREDKEEERQFGVSTVLKLYDPWRIRKVLFTSDVDGSSRLLLGKEGVEKHVLPLLGNNLAHECATTEGGNVIIFDLDTRSEHRLVMKRWSTGSFVLTSNWVKEFVSRRGLERHDEIGMYWDPYSSRFCFSLLTKFRRN